MKRKNTTTACQPCRKRRAKCDGHQPCCSRCRERALACVYSIEGDGRRPASKSHVQLLRKRIDLLERTLRAHSIDVDASPGEPTAAVPNHQHERPSHLLDKSETSGSLARDAAVTFEQDGEARYFGLSSGRLEFKINAESDKRQNPLSAFPTGQPQANATRLGINSFYQEIANEQPILADLEEELIHDYFKWEQPHVQVVDEKLFRDSRATGGKYYSPLLLNCILASASRYSLRPEVRADATDANTAGRLFLERAEILLPFDLRSPNITTLQSFCILGNVYVAAGCDAAGWLHLGMANRLALDMGLNLDSPNVTPSGWLSANEIELRKRIHWTLYCLDKTASMYTGRVCTMLSSQARVSLPEVMPVSQLDENAPPHDLRRSILGQIQRSLISVSRIIEKILLALYTPESNICSRQMPSFLSSTILELKNWHYDLPKELSLAHSGPLQSEPSVYINHMIHQTAYILLMKPILLKSGSGDSRRISHQAALEICNIGKKYRTNFGGFRQCPLTATYCTLSAVLTLLNAAHHGWEDVSVVGNNRHIEFGLSVLEELSVSWYPARRIWQNLKRMCDAPRQPINTEQELGEAPDEHVSSATWTSGDGDDSWSRRQTDAAIPDEAAFADQDESSCSAPKGHQAQPLDTFGDWLSGCVSLDSCNLPDSEFLGALHNFSYMEMNPIFQFDSLPNDYSSFDILNRIQVHNMEG